LLLTHDRATKFIHCLLAGHKGGKSLGGLASLVDSVVKACKTFNIAARKQLAPVGSSQSNGAAETSVNLIRRHANLLTLQAEPMRKAYVSQDQS